MLKKALVILADGFEEIEAITSIDILRRGYIDVTVAALSTKVVTGAHGIKISADILLEQFNQDIDALVLPGGSPGSENLNKSKKVHEIISKTFKANKVVAAICAAPALVLEPAGILKNKRATCYPGMEKLFSEDVKFIDEAVVRDGNLITSRGIGAALRFALCIVETLIDKSTADALAEKVVV
ncbi:MAG TPA: DJ-1/PfpI family protein [Candidatus Omnitrophica bacterium]|nr:DJ-1/PfpI family protein [Candidatus Omnitrophota bacterium]